MAETEECKMCNVHCFLGEESGQSADDSQTVQLLENRIVDIEGTCVLLRCELIEIKEKNIVLENKFIEIQEKNIVLDNKLIEIQEKNIVLENDFTKVMNQIRSENQQKMLIRKLQEYYRIYLTIKFPNEFSQYFNCLSKSKKKKYIIRYEEFFKYLPPNYASEDNNQLDFEELIINSQYWDNCVAAHTITESNFEANQILKDGTSEVKEFLNFIFIHKIEIEQQKAFLKAQNII